MIAKYDAERNSIKLVHEITYAQVEMTITKVKAEIEKIISDLEPNDREEAMRYADEFLSWFPAKDEQASLMRHVAEAVSKLNLKQEVDIAATVETAARGWLTEWFDDVFKLIEDTTGIHSLRNFQDEF